jgi:hypothetical protein
MLLDCGHNKETGFFTSRGLLCFLCAVKPQTAARIRRRRTHAEAVLDRERRQRAIVARREFYARHRAAKIDSVPHA